MRIAVLTDVHANLPALEAALHSIDKSGYDLIVHTGDLIGIGPFPKECCDLLLSRPDAKFIMGNHDAWFVNGLPDPVPAYMNEGEVEHHHWVHAQLNESLRQRISLWPYELTENIDGVGLSFVHYGLVKKRNDFVSVLIPPQTDHLDAVFNEFHSDVVFYGHDHIESDLIGKKRYVNSGALGCHNKPVARYSLVDISSTGIYSIERKAIEYDDAFFFQEFENRKVPERDFIKKAFFLR